MGVPETVVQIDPLANLQGEHARLVEREDQGYVVDSLPAGMTFFLPEACS
jgi:hypothetical protein